MSTSNAKPDQQTSPSNSGDNSQISHVLNKDKKYLSEHGQKLFNAINCLLDEGEQLELTQALFKYQRDHNVFTLVRSCREVFDTPRKKSLMLFMRPVIPVKDRFHYDEYYKLFFPEEFTTGVRSIFTDLIPKELLEKTLKKAEEKKKQNMELEKEKEMQREREREKEKEEHIKLLEKANFDLNLDIEKLMSKASLLENNLKTEKADSETSTAMSGTSTGDSVKIAGFRIIDLEPKDEDTLGFDVCLGPTGTFIMISYVEPNSLIERLGMKVGDELVSVNEISFKMIDLDQAIEVLSTAPTLRIVLQTSGFMPEADQTEKLSSNSGISQSSGEMFNLEFNNEWLDPFSKATQPPGESKTGLKKYIRRMVLRPRVDESDLGIKIRGGIEYALGIFISHVRPRSTADLIGLRVCDQIMEVNGQKFSRLSHDDALFILKTSFLNYKTNKLPIKITVRYLSKLPVLRMMNQLKGTAHGLGVDSSINYVTSRVKSASVLVIDSNHPVRKLFKSEKDFTLFKFYLSDYLDSIINIQYFLHLLFNRVKLDKEILKSNPIMSEFIKTEDEFFYKHIMQSKLKLTNDVNTEDMRFLTDDFKNGLIVRSTEVLNDLNINPCTKFNKYENIASFKDLNLKPKKTLCKSLDCLNIKFF